MKKFLASFLSMLSLAAAGGGVVALPALAEKPSTPPACDRFGDPLPEHALTRLGTSRLRHGGSFMALAYSPDGKWIATTGHDGTVRLWDASSGKAVRVLGRDKERRLFYVSSRWLFCLAFSPDGKRLAVGEHVHDQPGGQIYVWDTASGKQERRFMGHRGGVFAVAFSPNGKMLASSGAKDGKIRLWDVATGKELHTLDAGASSNWLAFSPKDKVLASAGGKVIRLWNTDEGIEDRQLEGHRDNITGIAFRPDGEELASVSQDKTLRLWNLIKGSQRDCWTGPDFLHGIAFSPDGKTIATGAKGPILLWNAATGKEERRLRCLDGEVRALAFAPDGKTLATNTDGERCVRLWDLQTGAERAESAAGHHGSVGFLRFAPDGQALLSAGCESLEMFRWKIRNGERLWQSQGYNHPFAKRVDLSPDGKLLAAGMQTGSIRLVDALTGKEAGSYEAHQAPVEGVAFSPDGKTLASCAKDKTLCLGNVAEHRVQHSLESAASFVRFSPDGKVLASASPSGPIELRDAVSGRVRLRLLGQVGQICSLAYSPDGRWLAAGTTAGNVQIWDAVSGQKSVPAEWSSRLCLCVGLLPRRQNVGGRRLDAAASMGHGHRRGADAFHGHRRRCFRARHRPG